MHTLQPNLATKYFIWHRSVLKESMVPPQGDSMIVKDFSQLFPFSIKMYIFAKKY